MTATITDINEYRTRKYGMDEVDRTLYFKSWTNDRIQKQYELLEYIRQGLDPLTDMDTPAVRLAFPSGFDPANHPEDNIDTVYAEGVRRGVFVTSV